MKYMLPPLALFLLPVLALGDGAWMHEIVDDRGRVVSVEPRQSSTIAMRREMVSLVPYVSGTELLLYANVRYVFASHGGASTLPVGFPEMQGRVVDTHGGYGVEQRRVTPRATIDAFMADVSGRDLPVRVLPGTGNYARWFVFDVPFSSGETLLRNIYIAHPGSRTHASSVGNTLAYTAEYILHTGSQWAGPIGDGDIALWDGRAQQLRHFTDLVPSRRDDVAAALHVTSEPGFGRPAFLWDYGNGRLGDYVTPRMEPTSAVQSSSALSAGAVPHIGAMALDDDPDTAWIDGGAHGGVGEWLQVPVHRMGRLRGLTLRSGAGRDGTARIRRLRLTCYDLEGTALAPTAIESQTVDLADQPDSQRVDLPHPMGACHAVRLTIEALHGPAERHGTLAEIGFIE